MNKFMCYWILVCLSKKKKEKKRKENVLMHSYYSCSLSLQNWEVYGGLSTFEP